MPRLLVDQQKKTCGLVEGILGNINHGHSPGFKLRYRMLILQYGPWNKGPVHDLVIAGVRKQLNWCQNRHFWSVFKNGSIRPENTLPLAATMLKMFKKSWRIRKKFKKMSPGSFYCQFRAEVEHPLYMCRLAVYCIHV